MYRDQRRLTIGFYTGDGLVEITPAMKRGVLEAKTLLQQMGHSVSCFEVLIAFVDIL